MGIAAAAGIAAVGSIGSAAIGSKAAKKAGKAQVEAADKSAEVQRYMFDTAREDQKPWMTVGSGALYKLADLYGVPRPVAAQQTLPGNETTTAVPAGLAGQFTGGAGDAWMGALGIPGFTGATGVPGTGAPAGPTMTEGYDDWKQSPGYEFRRDEGLKAIQRMGSAQGARFSPSTWKAAARYSSNLASDEYNNYTNALRSMAGIGQQSASNIGSLGVQTGQGIANAYINAGNARASSYGAQGAVWGNALNNIGYGLASQFGGGGGGYSAPPLTPNVPYQFGGLLSGQRAV